MKFYFSEVSLFMEDQKIMTEFVLGNYVLVLIRNLHRSTSTIVPEDFKYTMRGNRTPLIKKFGVIHKVTTYDEA